MGKIFDSQLKMQDLIKALFEKAAVKGVGCLMRAQENPENANAAYTLITNLAEAENCIPFYPFMPANAAAAVSKFTRESAPSDPIALFLRPCELRAVVELTKIKQVNLDNLILISFDCGGVFPLHQSLATDKNRITEYNNALKKGNNCPGIRPVCTGCDQFVPESADITISIIGRDMDESLGICFCSDKGKEVQTSLGLSLAKEINKVSEVEILLEQRKKAKIELSGEIEKSLNSMNGLIQVFDNCISCHACSYVCPICYCKNCYFDSQTFEYQPESYFAKMGSNGVLRFPTDRILFHLGRLSHMSTSCVACGMCEDVCPVDIPVSRIFKTAGEKTQNLFHYSPGQNINDPFPLLVYKEEELTDMED
ncbi:MAG: 4Fe-4S binding protein [Desulfobacterales bacterium]|nr:4Fe-4S binding protein [Desulfobacterales bacterium]